MQALIYEEISGKPALTLQEKETPKAHPQSAVIRVDAASICGTDLRTYRYGSPKIAYPRIIGHESVGTIVDLGSSVKGFQVGDRVQTAPAIGCGTCISCLRGYTNLCDSLQTIGFDFDGSFAQYMEIPVEAFLRNHVTPVSASISPFEAVLAEPIACIVNAQQYLHIGDEDIVAVFGSGFIGTMHAWLAYHQGAKKVFMIDVQDRRIAHAKELLPDLIGINSLHQPLKEIIWDETGGNGADVAITACSAGSAQRDALNIAAKRGRISLFGGLPGDSTGFIDSNQIHYKEISVFGAHASTAAQNRQVLELITSGKLPASYFAGNIFPLSKIHEAFAAVDKEQISKAVIAPNPD